MVLAPEHWLRLEQHLLENALASVHPPRERFRHPWFAPSPPSQKVRARLGTPVEPHQTKTSALSAEDRGDRFVLGDYSLGLFHHDASEAAIELLDHDALRPAAIGSLLCFLDTAHPSGRIHRTELSHKSRQDEPSKPVMAQWALRVVRALGDSGPEWALSHRVFPRIRAFIDYLEREYVGLHGLFLTHSSLQTGFDSDLLTASLPDRVVEGPDTNAFMVLEYRALAELAALLGEPSDEWQSKAERLRETMEQLCWYEDDQGGFYVGLRWAFGVGDWMGEVVAHHDPDGVRRPLESWTTLLPLYAGIPSPERAARLVKRLLDPERYFGPHGVRTLPRNSFFFQQAPRVMLYDPKKNGRGPVSNWSGPVWVLSNYYLAEGLARYGYQAEAKELARRTIALLSAQLERDGRLSECFDDEGRGLWPVRGTFISWNVLALTLGRRYLGLNSSN